eukprot:Gb_38588 [translate_table: standard]
MDPCLSLGVYKPRQGFTIDDVVAHITRVAASLEQSNSSINFTILRSVRRNWAAVLSVWKGPRDADNSCINLPEASTFTKGESCAVRMVECGWFKLSCREHIESIIPSEHEYSVGDIVSVRRIYSGGKKQETLVYSCKAVSKAYFAKMKGIFSYSFYESLDGKQIVGLGSWDSADSAYEWFANPDGSPGEAFWKSLGAHKLKYHVCQVVYVTNNSESGGESISKFKS